MVLHLNMPGEMCACKYIAITDGVAMMWSARNGLAVWWSLKCNPPYLTNASRDHGRTLACATALHFNGFETSLKPDRRLSLCTYSGAELSLDIPELLYPWVGHMFAQFEVLNWYQPSL